MIPLILQYDPGDSMAQTDKRTLKEYLTCNSSMKNRILLYRKKYSISTTCLKQWYQTHSILTVIVPTKVCSRKRKMG